LGSSSLAHAERPRHRLSEEMMAFARSIMLAALLRLPSVQASKLVLDFSDTKRPTTKVVELLKGMQAELEAEGEKDEETYDKFKCWCTENTEAKSKSVDEAQKKVKDLQNRVQILLAKSQRLKTEAEKSEDEVAKDTAALDTAIHLRNQQNAEFNDDAKRITADLDAVTNAGTALAVTGNFLQVPAIQAAKPALQQIMSKHSARLSNNDKETLDAFLQQDVAGPSDSVMGVLDGLKDDFTADLEKVKSDEATQVKQFEELSAAKKEQIQAGIKQIENKKEEKANADEERAHKKQEIKDTQAQIVADADFAAEVKAQCAEMDSQWEERSKTRAEEMVAISKAVGILDSEEAHDNFAKSLSFFQEVQESKTSSAQLKEASATLQAAGKRLDSRLLTLALRMKIDKFPKVKEAMDDMAAALKKEQKDEIEQKDFCVKSFRENQLEQQEETQEKDTLVAKEATFSNALKAAEAEMESLTKEIAELKKQLQLASQNREDENKEFQSVIAEQRQTQILLKQALDVMGKFYNKNSLAQLDSSMANSKAPPGFKDYKANSKSFGVMGMLQQILSDTAAMEAEGTRAEKSAQAAYEAFAKDTTASVEKKEQALSDKTEEKAKAEKDVVQTRKSREGAEAELAGLADTQAQLHGSCDFLMTNFQIRQDARQEELDSITKAKQILNGATFAEIQLN